MEAASPPSRSNALTPAERRRAAAALIGGQVGAAGGLVLFGGKLLVPLLTAFLGSAAGPLALVAREHARRRLAQRWIRIQLRRAP